MRRDARWWWRHGPAKVGQEIECIHSDSFRGQARIGGKRGRVKFVHAPLDPRGHYQYGIDMDDGTYECLYPFQFVLVDEDVVTALARLRHLVFEER